MISPGLTLKLEKYFCCGLREAKREDHYLDDGKFHFMKKFHGSILLYGKRRSYFPFHAVVGPDWPMLIVVYFLVISINVITLWAIADLGAAVIVLGAFGSAVVLLSYTITACSDPGDVYETDFCKEVTPPLQKSAVAEKDVEAATSDSSVLLRSPLEVNSGDSANTDVSSTKNLQGLPIVPPIHTIECGQCQLQRPYWAHHCHYCKVCVDRLDHHCPWCGKCIGNGNLFSFRVFITSLAIQFYFLIGAAIYYGISIHVKALPHGSWFR